MISQSLSGQFRVFEILGNHAKSDVRIAIESAHSTGVSHGTQDNTETVHSSA